MSTQKIKTNDGFNIEKETYEYLSSRLKHQNNMIKKMMDRIELLEKKINKTDDIDFGNTNLGDSFMDLSGAKK